MDLYKADVVIKFQKIGFKDSFNLTQWIQNKRIIKFSLLISLIMVLFRFPVFAFLNLFYWARGTLILPLLILIASSLSSKSYRKIIGSHGLTNFVLLLGLILGCTCSLYLMVFNHESFEQYIIPNLSSSVFFLFFPIFLLNESNITDEDLEYIFNRIGAAVIFLGGGFFVFYKMNFLFNNIEFGFDFTDPVKLRQTLIPDFLGDYFGSTYRYYDSRKIGYLVGLEHSTAGIASFSSYFYFKGIEKLWLKKFLSSLMVFALSFFGLYSIVKSTSLWILLITFAVICLLSFVYFVVVKGEWLLSIIAIGSIVILLNFLFVGSMTYNRALHYIFNQNDYTKVFLPQIQGCIWEDFLFNTNGSASPQACSLSEWKFFDIPKRFGLLPILGWLYLCLLPFFSIFRIKKMTIKQFAPLSFCGIMIISSLHYPSIMAWGNNFIYILALFLLLPRSHLR